MTIAIISRNFENNAPFGISRWIFQISQTDADTIALNPDSLSFTTPAGVKFVSADIYAGSTVPPYGVLWSVSTNTSTGLSYLNLIVTLTAFFADTTIDDISLIEVDSEPATLANIDITYNPAEGSLNAAYRPIVFRCTARITGATITNYRPPIVYCDIYVNTVYYKTLSKTQPISDNGTDPEYEFDIQDVMQEVMAFNLPQMDGSAILTLTKTIKEVKVKFRNAKIDSSGFLSSEQIAPVQSTSSTGAIPGAGRESVSIYVLNSTLQHEDNQNLEAFLNGWKTGTWNSISFPLTKRPEVFKLCKGDSSYFPIVSESDIDTICLNYKLKGGTYTTSCLRVGAQCDPIAGLAVKSVQNNSNGNQSFNFSIDAAPVGGQIRAFIYYEDGSVLVEDMGVLSGDGGEIEFTIVLPLGSYRFEFKWNDCSLNINEANIFDDLGIRPDEVLYTVEAAPGNATDPVGGDGVTVCSFGNAWTKDVKINTATPGIGTQIINPNNDLAATPANLGTAGFGSPYSVHGIRWIKFTGSSDPDIWDVNPATGQLTGISTTYSC